MNTLSKRAVQAWKPDHYLKFDTARLRPAVDLLQQVKGDHVEKIVDLGCGTGNITPYMM